MNRYASRLAGSLSLLAIFAAGCASPEYRMNAAADRDDNRRAQFEHCRDQGRSDCDALLNAPVSSNTTTRGDSVREQERRVAYDRCIDRGGSGCDELLHHD